jgi:hypothetical protein
MSKRVKNCQKSHKNLKNHQSTSKTPIFIANFREKHPKTHEKPSFYSKKATNRARKSAADALSCTERKKRPENGEKNGKN